LKFEYYYNAAATICSIHICITKKLRAGKKHGNILIKQVSMEDFKRILVISRSKKDCRKAVHYGVSLAKKYRAELYVMHVVHDPFIFGDSGQ